MASRLYLAEAQIPADPFSESEKDIPAVEQSGEIILGMSLTGLKAKWGEPNSKRFRNNLGRGGSWNDNDAELFRGNWHDSWDWQRDDYNVTVSFKDDKCCVLEVYNKRASMTYERAVEICRDFLPGVEFETIQQTGKENISLYSLHPPGYYEFQYWGTVEKAYFHIKAPGLLKELVYKDHLCESDEHGILLLPVEKAMRSGMKISGNPDIGYSTRLWTSKAHYLTWNVTLAESKEFFVELTWSQGNGKGRGNLELDIMGKKELSWPIESTGGYHDSGRIFSRKIGTCRLPTGDSLLKIQIPDLANGPGIDLVSVRFIPAGGYEERLSQLKQMPRLGMYLYDLELLWGKSRPGRNIPLDVIAGKGDLDNDIYVGLSNASEKFQWYVAGLQINAVMYKHECVGLQFEMKGIKPNEALDIAKSLMSGTQFPSLESSAKVPFTLYSHDRSIKFQYWGDRFELKSSKLVRALRGEELVRISKLSNQPLLGLSLADIKTLFGPGEERKNPINIEKKGDSNDVDSDLYTGLNSQVDTWMWRFPDRDGLILTALFLYDKCISLDIHRSRGFTVQEALEIAGEFSRGINFAIQPNNKKISFTSYSTNFNKGYKLQNWASRNYMEIKASGLIRLLRAEHASQLKLGAKKLVDTLASRSELKTATLIGQPRNVFEKLFGPSEQLPGRNGLELFQWNFPNTTLALIASFSKKDNQEKCSEMTLVDMSRALDPLVAFAVARQLVAPLPLKIPVIDDPSKDFSITTSGVDKRFLISWEMNKNYGKVLILKDSGGSEPKARKPSDNSSFDRFKDLL